MEILESIASAFLTFENFCSLPAAEYYTRDAAAPNFVLTNKLVNKKKHYVRLIASKKKLSSSTMLLETLKAWIDLFNFALLPQFQ